MRRADRLFQIVQYLRSRRVTTATQLSKWLEVSERTIYRDIQDLSVSGVPVEGEAGVGYRLERSFDVPPIMFTLNEVEALVVGLRMAEAWAGEELAAASRSALAKVTLALPAPRREEVEKTRLFAPDFRMDRATRRTFDQLRRAISEQLRVQFDYVDLQEKASKRSVQPISLYYWGTAWTLGAWCESRKDFRNFRVDRMSAVVQGEKFEYAQERSLEAFLAAMQRR